MGLPYGQLLCQMGLPWLSSFDDGSSMTNIVKVNGSYIRERGRKIREVRRERERVAVVALYERKKGTQRQDEKI